VTSTVRSVFLSRLQSLVTRHFSLVTMLHTLLSAHGSTLSEAVAANAARTFYAHWPEAPSGKIYGETANADGETAFKGQLNAQFTRLQQQTGDTWVGEEVSPYGFPLGVTYPSTDAATLVKRATMAEPAWQSLSPQERAVLLIEALERSSKHFFEIGYSTMHTTGQGFVMSFQASGPHAFDRALEAIAMGYAAQTGFIDSVTWSKPMGKISVSIEKSYRIVPKGIDLVIGCSTFPVWNSVPGIFAGLVTGNSVIVKPHPGAVYPIAIVVAHLQQTLADAGLDPHIVQLAVDTVAHPTTMDLVLHPAVRIIDYTGGPVFGSLVEKEGMAAGKVVYTEKAGVNCAIIESVADLDTALDNLAFSLSLYGGQMCTAPQNIFIPKNGVRVGDVLVSGDDVAAKLREKVDALVHNEKVGPSTIGAVQNERTLDRVKAAEALGLEAIRPTGPLAQPGFDSARSVSPLILRATSDQHSIYEQEWFGPISFVISTDSFEDALALVDRSVRTHGALTTIVYTTDPAKQERAEDVIVRAGAPVAFNFNSYVWVNQSAAFSDFHGAGCNPAGNATFADWSFVTNRYNVIGVRKQA